jgi:hypothetical protein
MRAQAKSEVNVSPVTLVRTLEKTEWFDPHAKVILTRLHSNSSDAV